MENTQIIRGPFLDSSVAVGTAVGSSKEIDNRQHAGGSVLVPNGSTLTTLTFHGQHINGAGYVPLYDSDGVAVTLTVSADRVCDLPPACFGCPWIKLTGNAAGTVSLFLKG